MYKDKSVSVIIPCFNEENQVASVIETIPAFVDKIVVIDDNSKDKTLEVLKKLQTSNDKIILIENKKNQGVGGSMASGYKWSRDNNIDLAVRMDGDGQMDPAHLPLLLDPVASGEVDYTKTNRLLSGNAFNKIPFSRYFGNAILSMLTKIASGYWHIADSQSGYTAINRKALRLINWDKMYKKYGQPNDLLVLLNIYNLKVRDIYTEPLYDIGENSKLSILRVIFTIPFLLFRRFLYRLKEKYIIRDFHPLVFFYASGFLLLLLSIPLLVRFIYFWISVDNIPKINFLAWMLCVIIGIQFILFAMWFDMESNKDLK
jgi:glycosyltransferase involved in cell wall biosynthesis